MRRNLPGTAQREDDTMFEMFETALDMEVERRREVLLATMRASRGGKSAGRQVPGVARARHMWVVIAATRS
jgi:hypothetical protein